MIQYLKDTNQKSRTLIQTRPRKSWALPMMLFGKLLKKKGLAENCGIWDQALL